MGLYRDNGGRLIEIDDKFAEARGYTPAETGALGPEIEASAQAARGEERGALGDVNAGLTGIASGLTLGGSDVLLGEVLTPLERERVQAEIEAHPYLRTGGEILGGVAGAFAAPGGALARTPAGYLSNVAAREVEGSLARGGILGAAEATGIMGAEGAAQSVGQYVGHAALEDKEVTAEGLAGALGTGFEFGAIGGGAALGVAKGTMAARRLYSRVMDGRKAVKDAQSAWTLANEEALAADRATMDAAEKRLNDIGVAKREAQRYRNEARSAEQEARATAQQESRVPEQGTGVPEEGMGPEPLADVAPQRGAGNKTQPFSRPDAIEPSAARAFDEGLPSAREQMNDVAASIEKPTSGAKTRPFERPAPGSTARVEKPAPTELEAQLAATKAAIGEGRSIKEIGEGMKARAAETLSEIRYKSTEDLLGAAVAKEEKALQDAVDELKAAHADTAGLEISDGIPEPIDTKPTGPGGRRAAEILDDVHEESLLRARYAQDPVEASQAINQANTLEYMIDGLSDGIPKHVDEFGQQLQRDIERIWRREQASAKLADVMGDAAHPVTTMRAKALRDAEKDAERKLFDRTTRAIDDAELTPKQRLQKAQRRIADLSVDESEARAAYDAAGKKVRVGEKAKKAALRADAKAAAAASKLGAQDVGGMLEMLDLPGMPKPSDLPVVGPLLGAYLKFRTLKRAMGRFAGRVPATADAKVATLANQTRDRIARGIDRSLGVLEKGAKSFAKVSAPAAAILATRIYDDGGENPPADAPITKLAAARMREINAYVHAPGAIERDVRIQLSGVVDPDVIAAAEAHRRTMMEYIQRNMPKVPEQGLLNKVNWEPSGAQAMSFARRLEAMGNPAGVFERLAEQQAMLSIESAEVMRDLYPRLFAQAQQRIVDRASEGDLKVPYRTRIQMAVLFKVPQLEPGLDPVNFQITQSVYDKKPSSPAFNPAAAPAAAPPTATPSIANPVDLSQAYMPSYDRR